MYKDYSCINNVLKIIKIFQLKRIRKAATLKTEIPAMRREII